MINYTDNPILIDVTRKRNKVQKLFCVLCNNEKIQLECFNIEENRWKCPRCKNDYQLGFGEIVPSEDILESSHEEGENEGAILLTAEDELSKEDDTSKSDIAVPKYMKDSETTRVVEYREY
jgi:hypothetical protein